MTAAATAAAAPAMNFLLLLFLVSSSIEVESPRFGLLTGVSDPSRVFLFSHKIVHNITDVDTGKLLTKQVAGRIPVRNR
jgi:hypothetical protein